MNQINFEDDQTEILDKTSNINKLANKIKEMQAIQKDIKPFPGKLEKHSIKINLS